MYQWTKPVPHFFLCLCVLVMGQVGLSQSKGKAASKKVTGQKEKTVKTVTIDTSLGKIHAELYPDKAKNTVANFVKYVEDGYYDGTIFHRVIPGFMIQGGGFTEMLKKKPTLAAIKNEADNGLKNETGTLAMARTQDPHSATSQFFINQNNNVSLNYTSKTTSGWGYAVFGKVTKGMDVVNKIANVPRGHHPTGMSDVPKETVKINSIKVDTKTQ